MKSRRAGGYSIEYIEHVQMSMLNVYVQQVYSIQMRASSLTMNKELKDSTRRTGFSGLPKTMLKRLINSTCTVNLEGILKVS